MPPGVLPGGMLLSSPRRIFLVLTYRTPDWNTLVMNMGDPFRELEPPESEIAAVHGALNVLQEAGVVLSKAYDEAGFLAYRAAVAQLPETDWSAITPRMQRLLYAINAIIQPENMIAAGIFWGNTFLSNAGAAVGPGACYQARQLIGVEINPELAAKAERNVRSFDPTGVARIVADDAVNVARDFGGPIHLLYLDADGAGGRGKGVYLDILEAGYEKMPKGSVVLAHNSVNAAQRLEHYLEFVRDGKHFSSSVNVIFDKEGLEVSVK
jgi:predicted O-methyltransferase YrrM